MLRHQVGGVFVVVSAAVAAAGACKPGGAAETVRSAPPTVASATGAERPETCNPDASYDALVVDLEPEVRGDLEVALKQGVVVVRYDCDSVELLEDCSLSGEYGYLGMSRKEKVLTLANADEVKANLPFTGVKLIGDLEASLARGHTLDVAMIMIGKRATPIKSARLTELDGDCDGATHYIRDVTVGAFAMQTGSSAEVKSAATIFGRGASGSSASTETIQNRDGELEACAAAGPDSKAPPAQCQSVLRVRLRNLSRDADAAAAGPAERLEVDVATCPPRTVAVDGACRSPAPERPHQCQLGDADGCRGMCERGDAASCYILGSMHRAGLGATRDLGAAAALLDKACAGEQWSACTELAALHRQREVQAPSLERAAELADRACDEGHGLGCVEHGLALIALAEGARGKARGGADQAIYRFRRACYGGEYEGCTWVGTMYAEGKGGVNRSPKVALKFFEKACKEGSGLGCFHLADAHERGKGTRRDAVVAAEIYERSCRLGHQPACR